MKRLLLLAYQFPPVGGAGVQRAVKLVKYLRERGWECTVLTVADPSVPVSDESLVDEIPEGTRIVRARTFEPSYRLKRAVAAGPSRDRRLLLRMGLGRMIRGMANLVLQPDPQILWIPDGLRMGRRILRQIPHDAILATAPPFSTFLLGRRLSRRFQLPLIADYRDEWSICNSHWENRSRNFLSGCIQKRQQRLILRQADVILTTTLRSSEKLNREVQRVGSRARVHTIFNGFDPADFESEVTRSGAERFRLSYIGTLWNLTNVAPLVQAIEDLCRLQPRLGARLEIVFAGRRTAVQDRLVDRLSALCCRLVRHDYLAHSDALELLKSSDASAVILDDVDSTERVVPAKVFECMAAGHRILGVSPTGELSRILAECPQARVHHPSDSTGIRESLADWLEGHASGCLPSPVACVPLKYDRREQAREVATILNRIVSVESRKSSAPCTQDLDVLEVAT